MADMLLKTIAKVIKDLGSAIYVEKDFKIMIK